MAAPANMETETLHAPDSDPTPQKDEIDQRGVEAPAAMEQERVLEHTTDAADERPQEEGTRGTVTTMPTVPRVAG